MRRLPAAVNRLPYRVRIAAEIEALSPRERHVLTLCLIEHLTPLEAAAVLHMPAGELERSLASTLERLAAVLPARRSPRATKRAA